jgi:hypothetical protein
MTLEEIQNQHRLFLEQAQEQYRQTIENATAMMRQQLIDAQRATASAPPAPQAPAPTVEWTDGKLILNEPAAKTLMEVFGALQQGLQDIAGLLKQQQTKRIQ